MGKSFQDSNQEERVILCIRLLLDSYLRQLSYVAWGLSFSNVVKQGAVLSPILFTLYNDILLIRLKHAHNRLSYE